MPDAKSLALKRFRKLRVLILVKTQWTYHLKITKAALLIGINYTGVEDWEMKWAHKDVRDLEDLLVRKFNYLRENIVVLTDEQGTPEDMRPTMNNINRELKSFVRGRPDCRTFVFAYSGHAFQKDEDPSKPSVEDDKMEEYIIPLDAVSNKSKEIDETYIILDKETMTDAVRFVQDLKVYLVDSLGNNSQLIAFLDTCHSGTLLNLFHQKCNVFHGLRRQFRRGLKQAIVANSAVGQQPMLSANITPLPIRRLETQPNMTQASSNGATYSSGLFPASKYVLRTIKAKNQCSGYCVSLPLSNKAQAVCLSACKDNESNLEDPIRGAMIQSIIQLLEENQTPSYKQLMEAARAKCRATHEHAKRKVIERVRKNHPFLAQFLLAFSPLHQCHGCLNNDIDKKLIDVARQTQEPQLSSLRPLNSKAKIRI